MKLLISFSTWNNDREKNNRHSSPKKERRPSPKKERSPSPKKERSPSPKKEVGPSTKNIIISTVLDFVPVVSNVKSMAEAITGKNYITGEKLSNCERIVSTSMICGGAFLKAAKKVTEAAKFTKTVNNINKIMKEEKIISKNVIEKTRRHGTFNEAKRNHGIPRSQQPDIVEYNYKSKYINYGKNDEDKVGKIREYVFKDKNIPNREVIIREDLGHKFGEQKIGHHFNVEVRKNGKIINDKKHYYIDSK